MNRPKIALNWLLLSIVVAALSLFGLLIALSAPAHAAAPAQASEPTPGAEQLAAQRLALMAVTDQQTSVDAGNALVRGTLLAVESLRQAPNADAATFLQQSLDRLPRLVSRWPAQVRSWQFSPDDRMLALVMADKTVQLWRLPEPNDAAGVPVPIASFPSASDFQEVEFSPNSALLMNRRDGGIEFRATDTGQLVAQMSVVSSSFGNDAYFSSDGARLIVQTAGVVEAINVSSLPTITPPIIFTVTLYAVGREGRTIVTVEPTELQARVWDASSGAMITQFGLLTAPSALYLMEQPSRLLALTPNAVYVFDVATGQQIGSVPLQELQDVAAPKPVSALVSPSRSWLLVDGQTDFQTYIGSLATVSGEAFPTNWFRYPYSGGLGFRRFQFSNDERWLAAYTFCTVRDCPRLYDVVVWNWSDAARAPTVAFRTVLRTAQSVGFSPNSRWMVLNGDVIDLRAETLRARVDHVAQFSPGGRWLAGLCDNEALCVWGADPGHHWQPMEHALFQAAAVAFSPDSQRLASVGGDSLVRLWAVASGATAGELAMTPGGDAANSSFGVAFSRDGAWLAAHGASGELRVWATDLFSVTPPTAALTPTLVFSQTSGGDLEFAADGRWLRVGADLVDVTSAAVITGVMALDEQGVRAISGGRVWELATGATLSSCDCGPLGTARFSPDGTLAAGVVYTAGVVLWDAQSGEKRFEWPTPAPVQAIHFAANGQLLLARTEQALLGWDVTTGATLTTSVSALPPFGGRAAPDATVFANIADEGVDLYDGAGALSMHIPTLAPVTALEFSPDGAWLATADAQGSVQLWRYRLEDLLAEACAHLPRNLTDAEWQRAFGSAAPRPTCVIRQANATPALLGGSTVVLPLVQADTAFSQSVESVAPTPTVAAPLPAGQASLMVTNGFDQAVRFTVDQRYRPDAGPSEYELKPGQSVTLVVFPGEVTFSVGADWRGLSGNGGLTLAADETRSLIITFRPRGDNAELWELYYE